VGYFEGHGVPKASQQPREPEEIPCEGSVRDPLETEGAAMAEWPEGLKAWVEALGGHFE
jgi:hypothetical protein